MDVSMTVITCGDCGVSFALADDFIAARRRDHRRFYCPNGDSRYYPQKSELDLPNEQAERCCRKANELKRQLECARGYAETLEYQRRAAKGQATKLQKSELAEAARKVAAATQQYLSLRVKGETAWTK